MVVRRRTTTGTGPAVPTVRLTYGLLPEWARSDEAPFTLVDHEAARLVIRAFRCRTWGSYVRLSGRSWRNTKQEWGEWLAELNEDVLPRADSPFSFVDIFGSTFFQGEAAYWVSRWVAEPREAAAERIRGLSKRWLALIKSAGLKHDGGSPAGHIETIDATDPRAFARFRAALAADGVPGVRISRDDKVIARCLGADVIQS